MRGVWGTGGPALVAAGLGLGLFGRAAARRREADLRGQVTLITGGSRGLGFLLAGEFAREGCRLAICARDDAELQRARDALAQGGAEVMAEPCDVADRRQAERFVEAATSHYGRVDVLVNNAGVIQVGPLPHMTLDDFRQAHDVLYWGTVYPTLAVLPQMRARRGGRVVNITSFGGKVSQPHLVPYCAAKFAAVGFSEGLRAELARDGIAVVTIVPGLMRTGSPLNAFFKGRHEAEFTLFSALAGLPLVSMDAARAARQIVRATKRGEAERILSVPANVLARFHGLFPGLTADLLGAVNRVLPAPAAGSGDRLERGMEVYGRVRWPLLDALTAWNLSAARRFHQHPGPRSALPRGPQEAHGPRGEAIAPAVYART